MKKQLVAIALTSVIGFVALASVAPQDSQAYERLAADTDERAAVENAVLTEVQRQAIQGHINASYGTLVMTAAGIGSILSSSYGSYRQALAALTTQVGRSILRSLVEAWFDDSSLAASDAY